MNTSTSYSIHIHMERETREPDVRFRNFPDTSAPFVTFDLSIGGNNISIFMKPEQVQSFKDALATALDLALA